MGNRKDTEIPAVNVWRVPISVLKRVCMGRAGFIWFGTWAIGGLYVDTKTNFCVP
jgi:hypothetical protein